MKIKIIACRLTGAKDRAQVDTQCRQYLTHKEQHAGQHEIDAGEHQAEGWTELREEASLT